MPPTGNVRDRYVAFPRVLWSFGLQALMNSYAEFVLYRMCCLNCALTGSKKPKLSSKLSSRKQADDDDDDDDYDDDDDDYDEADVPLPDVRVKPTTQQFYEQNKEKVAISSCVLLFLHTSSYQHTFCHITTDIWLIKCCF